MRGEQQRCAWWSRFALLVVVCLIGTACRVEFAGDPAQQAAGERAPVISLPAATSVVTDTPTVTPAPTQTPTPAATPIPGRRPTPIPVPAPPIPTVVSPTSVPTLTPPSVSEQVDDTVPVLDAFERMEPLNVRLNFWIYHRGAHVEGSSDRNLYRTHAWRKDTERLTEHGGVTSTIELSPNGRWLAYLVESGPRSLHVMDVELGTWSDMGQVTGFGFISWSPDSQEVLVNHRDGASPSGAIRAINIANGSRRTLIESNDYTPSIAVLVDQNDLVLWQVGAQAWRLVRMRLDTGERLAELETSHLGYRAYDAENRMLYLTQDDDKADAILAIDLSQQGLEFVEIPTLPNEESDVAISPDGTRLAYVNDGIPGTSELYFVDLLDPTAVLHLTRGLGSSGKVRGAIWAPASTAVVFGYGPRDREQLMVVGQEGTIFPIEVPGVPAAIVPDGT